MAHIDGMSKGATPKIYRNAIKLREKQTPAEEKLWEELKERKLGIRFRRQHPVAKYIVDFYCHQFKLAIGCYSAVEKTINSLVTYPFCHNFCLKNTKFPLKLLRFQIYSPTLKHGAIEIDGGYHETTEQKVLDSKRTKNLEQMGLKVIRFKNDEVLSNTEDVIERITKLITD